jgi:dihydrodipicolinate synthase/N-acetylneuraminate lyase
MDTVALAATISGFLLGLAGVLSNVAIAWIRRGQDVALAEKQHAHERELARGSRLYERRAPVYEAMMGVVQPVMEHVEARNRIITTSSDPPLPPEPSLEAQRDIQVQLRTHGSKEIADA